MCTLWMNAVSTRSTWEKLHGDILNYFLTPLRLRELQLFAVERPQKLGELFMDYVEECIVSAFALKVQLSEHDVIESILNRCLPETRMHFSFDRKPNSLGELRSLAGRVSNSLKSDIRYFGQCMPIQNHPQQNYFTPIQHNFSPPEPTPKAKNQ